MDYARSRGCRHARIADYFGQEGVDRTCRACDSCLNPAAVETISVPAADVEAALACVARFEGHLGAARVALILHGQVDSWARSKAWVQELAFFGSLRAWEVDRIRDLIGALLDLGYVARGHGEKPTLRLTPLGLEALSGEQPTSLELENHPAPPTARRRAPKAGAVIEMDDGATLRFEELRGWRLEVARRDEVPPYVIFHDKTLAEMARRHPASSAELASIPGVGPAKLTRYGEELLELLAKFAIRPEFGDG
jgi:ATP-dependent DNA helicase RecQ